MRLPSLPLRLFRQSLAAWAGQPAGAPPRFPRNRGRSSAKLELEHLEDRVTPSGTLVVTLEPPASVSAGAPFGLVVEAEDGSGKVLTSFDGCVTLSNTPSYYADPVPIVEGQLIVKASQGVATFTGLSINQSGPETLTVTAPVLTSGTSTAFTVSAAPATQLVPQDPSSSLVAGSPFTLTVDAEDPYGNVDSTFQGDVTVVMGNNPTNAALGGNLTARAVNGVATFPGLTISQGGTGFSLQATSPVLMLGSTDPFNVMGMDQLVVTTPPPSQLTAGKPFNLTISAEDGAGNVIRSFDGVVTVSGHVTVVTSVQAVDGVATFTGLRCTSVSVGVFPPGIGIGISSPGLDSTDAEINVLPGTAKQLVIWSPFSVLHNGAVSSSVLQNGKFTVIVQVEDSFGNVDSSFTGDVKLALENNPTNAKLAGTRTVKTIDGKATFSGLTINTVGTGYTLRASTGTLRSDTSAVFDVTDQLVVITQPPSQVDTNAGFSLRVSVEDGAGHVVHSFNGDVTVAARPVLMDPPFAQMATFQLGGKLTVRAVNGVASFTDLSFSLPLPVGLPPASEQLLLTSPGVAWTGWNIVNVVPEPAPADKLVADYLFGTALANERFFSFVYAEDSAGYIDPNFNGVLTLSVASGPAGTILSGTTTVDVTDGVASFNELMLNKVGNVILTASCTGLPTAIPITVCVEDQLVVTTQLPWTITAGASFGLSAMAEDGLGNLITSFNGPVTISAAGYLGGSSPIATQTVRAVNGIATFTRLMLTQAGDCCLAVDSPGMWGGSTRELTVNASPATQLVIEPLTNDPVVGEPFVLTVYAEDQFGDFAPYDGTVTLAVASNPGGAILSGKRTAVAANGEAVCSTLSLNQLGNVVLTASSPGLTSAPPTTISAVAGQLVVTTQPPSTTTVGTSFGLTVTVEDAFGNPETDFHGTVTLTLASDPGGGELGGTLSVTVVNGVAVFSGVTIGKKGNGYVLSITAPELQIAITSAIDVTGA